MSSASNGNYKDVLVEALCDFKCVRDPDVQDFLNTKAIDFEKRGWATTYLLLSCEYFDRGILRVEGYFSLTHKAVVFGGGVSLSSRNRITGNKRAETESFVLIGQLGKRIETADDGSEITSDISGVELLNDAMSIIQQSSDLIICRNIIVECKPVRSVKKIYEDYGFSDLQYDEEEKLHTLYLRLANSVVF